MRERRRIANERVVNTDFIFSGNLDSAHVRTGTHVGTGTSIGENTQYDSEYLRILFLFTK